MEVGWGRGVDRGGDRGGGWEEAERGWRQGGVKAGQVVFVGGRLEGTC